MKDGYKIGIGFWIGALVYSVINMIFNMNRVFQSNVLIYNYEIASVAVLGLILNIVLMKRKRK